jgi:hypothetical protein
VQADAGARLQRPLAEHQLQVRNLPEERVADRLAAAVVRARLGGGDLLIVLDDVAARRRLVHRRGMQRGACGDPDHDRHHLLHGCSHLPSRDDR